MNENESKPEGRPGGLAEALIGLLVETARESLVDTARRGGDRAARAMRTVLRSVDDSTDQFRRRIARLEAELGMSQASLRVMVGQPIPGDIPAVLDPPAGHLWTTAVHGGYGGPAADKRLVCVVCTPTEGPAVLAIECLARARVRADLAEAGPAPAKGCVVCGMVH